MKASRVVKFLLLALNVILLVSGSASQDDRKEYIVYMGNHLKGAGLTTAVYLSMLKKVISSDVAPDVILHSYHRSFNGFVVKLSEQQAQHLAGLDGVVSVFPNQKHTTHTTRSWDFLGYTELVERTSNENDIIIGVLDTGIWPESDSFKDDGLGPPPSKWNGTCNSANNFTCNNKIIGAQYYRAVGPVGPEDVLSPRDTEGHGTHTASTAAGRSVVSASLYGLGFGTARGGVPSARIAVYKVCWSDGCSDADILAGFDDAIADGVDIISLSVNPKSVRDFPEDSVAIGAFHAMKNKILTSNSGGNNGPSMGTTRSLAPWLLTVAASTIDRKFLTKVHLGNGDTYEGISLNTFDSRNKTSPLIHGGNAPNKTGGYTRSQSRYCLDGSLDPAQVTGKIVVCDVLTNGSGPLSAGAVGAIMHDTTTPKDVAWMFPLSASYLDEDKGGDILLYVNSTSNPIGTIYKSIEGNDTLAPYVATFSSRGPNQLNPEILKPDLAAPGVDILAAWTLATSIISGFPNDKRFSSYNIISGTSMACPHASAIAAYVKSFHPTWSPAAIKSALMTTASSMSPMNNEDAELAYGAGHINPLSAVDPGLVYDADETDYVKFLCGQGYNETDLQTITSDNSVTCSGNETVWDLNYPSFALPTPSLTSQVNQTFTRTLTNVGNPTSTYKCNVTAPANLIIHVSPEVLSFNALNQKLSFTVTVQGSLDVSTASSVSSASLVWDDGTYKVKSPIIVYLVL